MRAIWSFFKAEPLGVLGVLISLAIGAANYYQHERSQRSTDARFEAEQLQRQKEREEDQVERKQQRKNDQEAKRARVIDNGIRLPVVRPGRCEVTLKNPGDEEVAVKEVRFQYYERIATPSEKRREATAAGILPTHNICFDEECLDSKTKTFALHLSPPVAISPGTNLYLQICICEEKWAKERLSYKGRLEVIYDANNSLFYENVTLDIMKPAVPPSSDQKRPRRKAKQ